MTTITPLEFKFIKDMVFSDHSTDGHGICMWVTAGYCSLRPNVWRGVVSSLMQKGIIGYSEADPGYRWQWDYEAAMGFNERRMLQPAWVQIREEYQVDVHNTDFVTQPYDSSKKPYESEQIDGDFQQACAALTGYRLNDLEVKA
jgi:hypothetical protein